jgi:hypothetical protein
MIMKTAEFSLPTPPSLNLKPTFSTKKPHATSDAFALTESVPDSFQSTSNAIPTEPASLRSGGLSFKQGLLATVATLGTMFAGGIQASEAHVLKHPTEALAKVEAPLVKALQETGETAVKSGDYLLAGYYRDYHPQYRQPAYHPQYRQPTYHPQYRQPAYHPQYRQPAYHPQYRQPAYHPQYRQPAYHPQYRQPTYHPQYRGY